MLRLPTDAFPADNELLLVRSAPAPVAVSMEIPEQSGKIFRNIINSLPGFSPVPDGSDPDLLLLEGKTESQSPRKSGHHICSQRQTILRRCHGGTASAD